MERKCDEEKATEEEKEKAAGAELKTKTPHKDVGKKNLATSATLKSFWMPEHLKRRETCNN